MANTGVISWSQTAASNGTADSTVNYAEGQSPASLNDSARAAMASVAKYRDDIAGAIVTGGTSTAFTVTSYQGFQSLSQMNGQVIAFSPNATNTGTSTLNVDSLGAKPLRSAPSVEIPAGTLVQGTPYLATYNNTDGAFYLQGFFGNPYGIMIGGMVDFIGTTAPNSSFVLPFGQAVSRTTYATLFGMVSTTFGSGDGSTTFNLPDLRGRIAAGKDDMGGSAASRLSSTSITTGGPTTLGGTGGLDTKTLLTANLPPYTPSGTNASSLSTSTTVIQGSVTSSNAAGGANIQLVNGAISGQLTIVGQQFTGNAQGGTSTAFSLAQPTMIVNKLLRII